MTAAHDDVEMPVSKARAALSRILDGTVHDGGIVFLTRNDRRVGAVVPAEVAERIAELEDAYWSRRAAETLAKGEPVVPWDEAVAMLEAGTADQ